VRRTLTGTTLGVLLATAGVVGQQQDSAPPAVTFRSAIEAVEIDVYITDVDGNPVSGLTLDDFELFEDGKPQPITTFAAVDIPIETRETVARASYAESDVAGNNVPEGRLYVFALDEVSGANILRTRQFLRDFIENHFGAHDLGAVALLGRGLATDGQDFTSSPRLLLEAVEKFSGGFSGSAVDSDGGVTQETTSGRSEPCRLGRNPGDVYRSVRSQQLASLRSMTELMERLPGRHKAMLFFTECVGVDFYDLVDYQGGVLGLAGEDAHAAMSAATRSNLAIYPIDPSGLTPDAVPLVTIGAFRAMADATGGVALINSNSFTQTFERIVRDSSTYYMLGFNSAYEKDDGRYVGLEVRTTRPGLTVRTRDGYVAPTRHERRARERSREREKAPASQASALVASPLATDGMPIRVFATPFRNGKEARVPLVVEMPASSLDLGFADGAYTGTVDVSYVVTDAKRRIFPEVRHTASVRVEPQSRAPEPLDEVRVRVVSELELSPGRYQLRVGAASRIQSGSVVYDLVVPHFGDGRMAMSGLAVIDPDERHVLTLRSDRTSGGRAVKCYSERCVAPTALNVVAPRPAPTQASTPASTSIPERSSAMTTVREFEAGDTVEVAFELYDNRRVRRGEKAAEVVVTAELHAYDGAVFPLRAEARPVQGARGQEGTHQFVLPLTLTDIAPGQYALRVHAALPDSAGDDVSREIRIVVR
jgi:VWFA-related protein